MAAAPRTRNPFVSVVIPVWNDAERLAGCLQALEAQTYADDLYEVIVIDNHPESRDGEDGEKIGQLVSVNAHSRVVHERRPGSYAARNTGVAVARGEIIGFTDADCIPAPDWIERGVGHLTALESNCAVVAGHVEIFPRSAAQPNAIERYEVLVALAQKEFVRKYRFGATANLFTFKEVLARAGSFLAEVKSGGDLEWGRRVTGYGYKLEYCENIKVFHPARASFAELYTKIVRVVGGHHDLKRLKGRSYLEFERSWLLDLVPPVKAMARVMREPSLIRWRDRIKVCTVLCFVRFVQAFERLRLAVPKVWSYHTTTR